MSEERMMTQRMLRKQDRPHIERLCTAVAINITMAMMLMTGQGRYKYLQKATFKFLANSTH